MINPLFSVNRVSGLVGANYIYMHSFMCTIDANCWDVAGSALVLSMYVIDCLFNSALCLYLCRLSGLLLSDLDLEFLWDELGITYLCTHIQTCATPHLTYS